MLRYGRLVAHNLRCCGVLDVASFRADQLIRGVVACQRLLSISGLDDEAMNAGGRRTF